VTRSQSLSFAVLSIVAVASHPAHADDASPPLRLPVPEAQRPLTLPRLVLAPKAAFQVDQRPGEGSFAGIDVSGGLGLTDDLAVHALVAPLQLATPAGYGGFQYGETNRNLGPGAGVTLRLLRGPLEIGADLSGHVFTIPHLSGGSVSPSLLFRWHATDMVVLHVAPAVVFQLATRTSSAPLAPASSSSQANAVRVEAPLTLLGNLTESFDVGVTTGLTIYDTSDTRNSTGIPAGVVLGYAVPGPHGPVVDINPFFNFPYLVMPGRASVTNTQQYQVGVSIRGYLYL